MKNEFMANMAGSMAQIEELRKLLNQLRAMTMMVSGEGIENFCLHNDEIKSAYLWAMSDVAERALMLTEWATVKT